MDEFIRKNDVYNLKNAFDALVKKEIKRDSVENIIFAKAMETAFNMIEQAVREVPTAEVAEVIHARWESVPGKSSRFCSHCGFDEPYKFAPDDAKVYNSCPHCGAKMDLK